MQHGTCLQPCRPDACARAACARAPRKQTKPPPHYTHTAGQAFGLITLDEISALLSKIGGGTMPHFECVHVLRELLARLGTRVLCLDAGADFTMSDTEPRSLVAHGLMLLAPHRRVIHLSLEKANKPAHLERKVNVHFGMDSSQKQAWRRQLDCAVAEWQAAHERNERSIFFVVVGTPTFGRSEVIPLLKAYGVPFKFYHGESNQLERFRDLSNPLRYWEGVCCCVFTTVLGRGVDLPRELNVSRIFAAFHRMGCGFDGMLQSTMRARHVQCSVIEVLLLGCMAPEEHRRLVLLNKRKAIVRPTYEQMVQEGRARRGWTVLAADREALAAGTANNALPVSDLLLRVMAHEALYRRMQVQDPVYAFVRLATYYDFGITHTQADAGRLGEDWARLQLDADQEFDLITDELEKWERVAQVIRERDEYNFFQGDCWGLAAATAHRSNLQSCLEQRLVAAFYALRHLGALPPLPNLEDPDELDEGAEPPTAAAAAAAAAAAEANAEAKAVDPAATLLFQILGNGKPYQDNTPALQLQAHSRVRTPEQQMQADSGARLELSLGGGKPGTHAHCELDTGMKMAVVARLARALLFLDRDLDHLRQAFAPVGAGGLVGNARPQLIDAANRMIKAKANKAAPTPADAELLKALQGFWTQLGARGKQTTLIDVLKSIAVAIGLRLETNYSQVREGDRRYTLAVPVTGLRFNLFLPDVVNGWYIWSPRLSATVRVSDWDHAHIQQQVEMAETVAAGADLDYGDLFTASFVGASGADTSTRVELFDDSTLQRELVRLQREYDRGSWRDRASAEQIARAGEDANRRHRQTAAHMHMARAIDRAADAADEHGVRRLPVVYGKNTLAIGRRTASAPSMQQCPKPLRIELCRQRYHDVRVAASSYTGLPSSHKRATPSKPECAC